MNIVLASASPRRRELLSRLLPDFSIAAVAMDENTRPGERPEWAARRLALAKALTAAAGDALYLGADTIVALDDEMLGKPRDASEAVSMLQRLRGRSHLVVTGLALVDPAGRRGWVTCVKTTVSMRRYGDEEIAAYVASGLPYDRAGGYGIQDEPFAPVAAIDGCQLNVVGLPLCAAHRLFRLAGRNLAPLEETSPECAAHDGTNTCGTLDNRTIRG